jgi:hypothetical protein
MSALTFAASLVAFSSTASAAPPAPAVAVATAEAASVDTAAASHCARAGKLIGSNCSYTTGMMARRVLEEGQDWTFVGELTTSRNDLASMVAAPFTVSDGFHVIANELVELMNQEGHAGSRLSLVGKLLEVDGVRYVVLTSFRVINT